VRESPSAISLNRDAVDECFARIGKDLSERMPGSCLAGAVVSEQAKDFALDTSSENPWSAGLLWNFGQVLQLNHARNILGRALNAAGFQPARPATFPPTRPQAQRLLMILRTPALDVSRALPCSSGLPILL
jgi:hypothetical protein